MILRELLNTIPNAQRIKISNTKEEPIFQGYRGVYKDHEYDNCEIDRTGCFTYIAPKGRIEEIMYSTEKIQPVPDNITFIDFKDLSLAIYIDIVIQA